MGASCVPLECKRMGVPVFPVSGHLKWTYSQKHEFLTRFLCDFRHLLGLCVGKSWVFQPDERGKFVSTAPLWIWSSMEVNMYG